MGGQQGKVLSSKSDHLNEAERLELKLLFEQIQRGESPTHTQGQACSKQTFQKYCEASLDPWIADRLASICATRKESKGQVVITLDGFLDMISMLLKGDFDEKVEFIFKLCSDGSNCETPSHTISGSSIFKLTQCMVTSCTKAFSAGEACKSWTRCLPANHGSELLSHYLLLDLFCPTGVPKDYINKADAFSSALSRKFTLDELITGLGKSMLFQNISNSAFGICFNFSREANVSKNLIPRCLSVQPALVDSNFTVMSLSHVIFLNSLLPSELRDKWRFLFSSSTHGESFSKCLSCIQEKGATILILKDDRGRIFGGFAPLSWKLGPKFFGTSEAFLFHLAPYFVAYSATNYNENFQYINIQQKTLPNGLGMGGTLEYFALWIDSEYGKGGCSPSCTTFSCPQLSEEKEFAITHLEVWGVGPEPQKEEGIREPQSVLDNDPELRAVLEIMGKKTNTSEGFRDLPEPSE